MVTTARTISVALIAMILGSVASCSRSPGTAIDETPSEPKLTALTLGEQLTISNTEHLASAEYSSTDSTWGERLAMQCRACHSLEQNGANMIGPALHGFFGKAAGRVSGYAYSAALAEVNFVWTPRALDAWLAQPSSFLPGNRMTFAGLGKVDDRRAVIAYLLVATDDGSTDE